MNKGLRWLGWWGACLGMIMGAAYGLGEEVGAPGDQTDGGVAVDDVGGIYVVPLYGQESGISIPRPDTYRLDWEAVPGQKYRIYTSDSLGSGTWTPVVPGGMRAESVVGAHEGPMTADSAFFRVLREDTDPPAVVALAAPAGAVAVPLNATVTVTLSDETGIDESSIRLSVAGWEDLTTESPYLEWNDGTLVFTPPHALGDFAQCVTNRLSVADNLGHVLEDFAWSFSLERATQATEDFIPLTAPPALTAVRLASGSYLRRALPGVKPLSGTDEYHIVSSTSNTVVFSYSGDVPTITNGTRLVSFDAAHPMYRRVCDDVITVDPALRRVTVSTTDLSLTNLVSEGSLSGLDLAPAIVQSLEASKPLGALNLLHVDYGYDFSGRSLAESPGVSLRLPSAWWRFTGDIDVSMDLFFAQLQAMDVSVSGGLSMELSPEVVFQQAAGGSGETPLVAPVSQVFGAMLGPVPVWVEVTVEVNAGYSYDAAVAGRIGAGVAFSKDLSFSLRLRDNQWTHAVADPPLSQTWTPVDWQIEGHANAKVHLRPKLTVLVFSLAGPWLDVKPYAELDGWAHLNPPEGELGLYLGLSSTLGIESRVWSDAWGPKPKWELFNLRQPLWYDRYPDETAPAFAAAFPDKTVRPGGRLVLSGHATGYPLPDYTWYCDGVKIPFETGPEYVIASANSGHQGTYTVSARNRLGSVQASCNVTIGTETPTAPSGMVLVPGGTNSGTDPDFGAYSLMVASFYMDATEVTKAQWDEVFAWAVAHGYSFDNAGAGKAANHPVHSVSWYDCVKWCNARSEKEGRQAVYTVGGAVYRTGQSDNVFQTFVAGYRLPTDDEWQYAARGGLSGKRFPWGNTINHTHANYTANGVAFEYDTSPYTTDTHHLAYNDGRSPYTAPVGSFPANGYGLYDMVGNVIEWCFDKLDDGSASASYRKCFGGFYGYRADFCRIAHYQWSFFSPIFNLDWFGFRSVLPLGQSSDTRVISVSGNLNFGDVFVGTEATRNLVILNQGNVNLTVSGISLPEDFTGDWSGKLAPGASQVVPVTFSPQVEKSYLGNLEVLSDATSGDCFMLVSGTGVSTPSGMVLIPGGTNSGTDPEFGAYSLTVSSFYMDVTEVTKAQWDDVYVWAIEHGYSFDNRGKGRAVNYPLTEVNWYDAVKWCNARSEMQGRTPFYTISNQVYKAGQSFPECNADANGFRLPTKTEWEYAARGGLSGRRFPWGDTITHNQANYNSQNFFSYDVSSTRGFHPVFGIGSGTPSPWTSPSKYFMANGYRLYDMAGNVREMCDNDVPGSRCYTRGGGWIDYADAVCCGGLYSMNVDSTSSQVGFRAVCR